MQDATHTVSIERTLAVSRHTGCSVYDSQFIALTEDISVPLYTCDKKLAANASHVAMLLEKLN